ncbi:MAG: ABC transporter ATP-binding protein [Oscillospiraceae bacterium]|nr:ABC transporter ATP-binding protein [Oscillospiraceae bacterium]
MSLWEKLKNRIKDGFFREMWRETKWMFRYIRRYRLAVFIHILLGMLATVMTLLSSVAMKMLIDVVTGFEMGGIWSAAGFMAGMMIGSILMQALSSRVAAIINVRVQNGIQAEVYDRMLRTDWQSLEVFRSGDLLNRLNGDVSAVAGGVTSFIPGLVSGVVQFTGSLVIILIYDPVMALIALVGAPVSVIASRTLMKTMREYNKRMKAIGSDVMSFHEDSLRNLTTIKSFGLMDKFSGRMRDMQGKYRDAYLEYNRFSVIVNMLMGVVGLIISAGCFAWGIYRLWTNAISYGTMTMFLQLTAMLRSSFGIIIGLVPAAISITTSAGRIIAVVELPEEEGARAAAEIPDNVTVRLDNASFGYSDDNVVLENVSFDAGPGQLVAIMGASGEGKTTMIRLLLGLIRPQEGRAVLEDEEGSILTVSASTRNAFSYVPQGNTVFAGTVAENLRMVKPEASEEEMWNALRIACAEDFVSGLPKGIYSETGELGRGFSEGQAQRISVARALLKGAPIMLLDEATSALDEKTEKKMLKNLTECGLVKTCIIVTHRPATAGICGRCFVLEGNTLQEELPW